MNSCSECRYFFATGNAVDLTATGAHGECRRYPPSRNDILTPQGIGQVSGWPTTRRNFYCGEWASREIGDLAAARAAAEQNGDAP